LIRGFHAVRVLQVVFDVLMVHEGDFLANRGTGTVGTGCERNARELGGEHLLQVADLVKRPVVL
jgi:hypothetical protein